MTRLNNFLRLILIGLCLSSIYVAQISNEEIEAGYANKKASKKSDIHRIITTPVSKLCRDGYVNKLIRAVRNPK